MKKQEQTWFKPKKYLHFTKPIGHKGYESVKAFIEEKDKNDVHVNVKFYAFYPLIHRTVVQRRFKKMVNKKGDFILTKTGKIKRSHYDYIREKSNAKHREIFFANHLDSLIYAYFAKEILGKRLEENLAKPENTELSKCITAYRFHPVKPNSKSGKSNIHFAKEVFEFVRKQKKDCVVLALDITKYFDSLDHDYLKKVWCRLLNVPKLPDDHYNVFKAITRFSFVNENDLLKEIGFEKVRDKRLLNHLIQKKGIKAFCRSSKDFRYRIAGSHNKKGKSLIVSQPSKSIDTQKHFYDKNGKRRGIAQGTALSAMLANLYLLEFDKTMVKAVAQFKGKGLYRRYSDDIIIVCPIEQAQQMEDLAMKEIQKYKLTIQAAKTEKVLFKRNPNGRLETENAQTLKYLGFEFDGQKITIKKSSLAQYYRKLKRFIRAKAVKANALRRKGNDNNPRLFKRQIYQRFSHFGRQNFVSYAYRASRIMNEPHIKKQLRRHPMIINETIKKYEKKYRLKSLVNTKDNR